MSATVSRSTVLAQNFAGAALTMRASCSRRHPTHLIQFLPYNDNIRLVAKTELRQNVPVQRLRCGSHTPQKRNADPRHELAAMRQQPVIKRADKNAEDNLQIANAFAHFEENVVPHHRNIVRLDHARIEKLVPPIIQSLQIRDYYDRIPTGAAQVYLPFDD